MVLLKHWQRSGASGVLFCWSVFYFCDFCAFLWLSLLI